MNPLDIVLAGLFEILGYNEGTTSSTPKPPKLDGSQKIDAKGQTSTTSKSGQLRNFTKPAVSANRPPTLDPVTQRSSLQATPPNRPPGGFGQSPGQLSFDPNLKPGQVNSKAPSVPPKLEAGAAGRAEKRLQDLKNSVKGKNYGKISARTFQVLTLLGIKPNYDQAIKDGYTPGEALTQALAAALVGTGSAKASVGGGKLQTAGGIAGSVFGDDAAIGLVRLMQDSNKQALKNQENNDTAMFAFRRLLNKEMQKRLGFSLPDPPALKDSSSSSSKSEQQSEIPTAPTTSTEAKLGEYTANNYPNQSSDPRILNSPELRKQLGIMMQQVTPIQKPLTNPNQAPIRAQLKPLKNIGVQQVTPRDALRPELYAQ